MKKISLLCLIVNLIAIAAVVIMKKNLPLQIPLFYGLPVSSDQLAGNLELIIPSIIAIFLIIINYELNTILKDKFLEKIFLGLIITLTALSTITVIEIFSLVGAF